MEQLSTGSPATRPVDELGPSSSGQAGSRGLIIELALEQGALIFLTWRDINFESRESYLLDLGPKNDDIEAENGYFWNNDIGISIGPFGLSKTHKNMTPYVIYEFRP